MGLESGLSIVTSLALQSTDYFRVLLDKTGSPKSRLIRPDHALRIGKGSVLTVGGSGNQVLVADSWVDVTQWTSEGPNPIGCTPSSSSDNLTVDDAGDWVFRLDLMNWTGQASTAHLFRFRWNGSETGMPEIKIMTDSTGLGTPGVLFLDKTAAATDVLTVQVNPVGAGSTFVVKEAALTAHRQT